jgi:hypothetical protein
MVIISLALRAQSRPTIKFSRRTPLVMAQTDSMYDG